MWERWARRGLLALSAILASFLVYLLATRVESVPAPTTAGPVFLHRADAGIDQFTFVQSRDGLVQWEVRAEHARLFEGKKQALLDQVDVTLFGPTGWEMKIAGDEGTLDTAKKDFTLVKRDGTIAVTLESGYTIHTNHLAWTDAQGEIHTSDPVFIEGHGLEVRGKGLRGRLQGEVFELLHDVHVTIAP